jgi:hypothetical protein
MTPGNDKENTMTMIVIDWRGQERAARPASRGFRMLDNHIWYSKARFSREFTVIKINYL